MALRGRLSVIAGRSNIPLATEAARAAGVELSGCDVLVYSDGELGVEVRDNVRGNDVFVVQSSAPPVNDSFMELLIIIDALKRASAQRITAVIPYFGYARQDRKTRPRVPITAKLVSDLIVTAGADRVMTMDLHAGQIMGFFNIPVDNLYAMPVLVKFLKEEFKNCPEICIVSPDAGGVARARAFAKRFEQASLAVVDKRRSAPNEVTEMNIVGDVRGKMAIIIDDIVDTGGTLVKAADALLEHGATRVVACCTHPVLSGGAIERIRNSNIEQLVTTDTIYHPDLPVDQLHGKTKKQWLVRLSVARLIGEAISRTHEEDSISSLFEVD